MGTEIGTNNQERYKAFAYGNNDEMTEAEEKFIE